MQPPFFVASPDDGSNTLGGKGKEAANASQPK